MSTSYHLAYGHLDVVGVTNSGRSWIASRRRWHDTAYWNPFVDLETSVGDSKPPFSDVSCAKSYIPRLTHHICLVDRNGRLWHVVGFPWQRVFSDIEGGDAAGEIGTVTGVSCAGTGPDLHVCAVTSDGVIYHTIRRQNFWNWQNFINILPYAGDRGPFADVACSSIRHDLHVCAVDEEGGLWHTIRFEHSGTWQEFRDIEQAAGERGQFARVSCGADYCEPDLHVCAVTSDGDLWHTIRRERQGRWEAFSKVEVEARVVGRFVDVSCDMVDLELQVCGVTGDGHLWHSIHSDRHSLWKRFGNIEIPAGERGDFVAVGIAGDLGDAPGLGDPYIVR